MTRAQVIKIQRNAIGAANTAVNMWDWGKASEGYVDSRLNEMREALKLEVTEDGTTR